MRYSEKECFNQCPYKYKLVYLEGLKKQEDEKSQHHLKWGQAIHRALELHYQGKPWEEVKAGFLSLYPKNLDDSDNAKTVENGVELLKRYITYYQEQDTLWEVLGTEVEGLIDIGDESHELHIDLIARLKQTSDIFFWDHKTSEKEPTAFYWKNYELSGQITRYTSYVQEKFGQCAGCYINNMAVKHLKRKNIYGEGPGLIIKFERQLFNRTPQQIAFWRASDTQWMAQIELARKHNNWPKALNTLCSYCEFYDLCLASGDEQIKELLYKQQQQDFNPIIEV